VTFQGVSRATDLNRDGRCSRRVRRPGYLHLNVGFGVVQGNDFAEDTDTGELMNLGFKMRAEGETAYEPDVLVRLESHKPGKKATAVPTAHVEKDRTGVLAGQTIAWPTFDTMAKTAGSSLVGRRDDAPWAHVGEPWPSCGPSA